MKLVFIFLLTASFLFSNETITIFANEYKPPKVWTTKDKIHKGILVEVVREVAKELDIQFDIQTYPWARSYKLAANAKGGIIGISINDERLKIFDYNTIPLFNDTMVLITKKGKEFKFESIEDLKDKKIGYCRGCSFGKAFEKGKKYFIPVETDDSREQRLKLLLNGKIDAALLGPGEYALRKICQETDSFRFEDFTILKKPLTIDPNYIAFSKKLHKKEFLKKFDAVLQKKIDEGIIEKIITKILEG